MYFQEDHQKRQRSLIRVLAVYPIIASEVPRSVTDILEQAPSAAIDRWRDFRMEFNLTISDDTMKPDVSGNNLAMQVHGAFHARSGRSEG
jgi:hypothetical protein